MNILIREVSGSFVEVKIEHDGTVIDLGLLDVKEIDSLATELNSAAQDLLAFKLK
jgi:hypothetical protein